MLRSFVYVCWFHSFWPGLEKTKAGFGPWTKNKSISSDNPLTQNPESAKKKCKKKTKEREAGRRNSNASSFAPNNNVNQKARRRRKTESDSANKAHGTGRNEMCKTKSSAGLTHFKVGETIAFKCRHLRRVSKFKRTSRLNTSCLPAGPYVCNLPRLGINNT